MRGRSSEVRERASRASVVMRWAVIGGVRRDAVVGLAIPGREGEDLDLGRDEAERVLEGLLPLPVAGDVDEDRRRPRRARSGRARGRRRRARRSRPARWRASGSRPSSGRRGRGSGRLSWVIGFDRIGRLPAGRGSGVDRRRVGVEALEAAEHRRVVVRRRRGLAGDPAEEVRGPGTSIRRSNSSSSARPTACRSPRRRSGP